MALKYGQIWKDAYRAMPEVFAPAAGVTFPEWTVIFDSTNVPRVFTWPQGEEHQDPFSLQLIDRVTTVRGAFF